MFVKIGAQKRKGAGSRPRPLLRTAPSPASRCALARRADAARAHAVGTAVSRSLPRARARARPPRGQPVSPAERCLPTGAAPPARVPVMEVLRHSSVFAAEIMDAFDRSPTDKELVAQAKALGREYVHARLLRAGLAWSAPERAAPAPGGRLAEVCAVLLRLGECGPCGRSPAVTPDPAGWAGPPSLGSAEPALARLSGDFASWLHPWASVSPGQRGGLPGCPLVPGTAEAQDRPAFSG